MKPNPLIVAVADASLGFGSPQIPEFMRLLREHYAGQALVLEPDTPEKPPRHDLYPDLPIERIYTGVPPYCPEGRTRYLLSAAERVNALKPDVLVVFCTYCVPLLFKLARRPKFVIYYSIESIVTYGQADIEMNRAAARWMDLVIFPEENRAARDMERCHLQAIPVVTLLNCANSADSKDRIIAPSQRNGRLINQGTIAAEWTFPDYYLTEQMQRMPVDIYGPVEGQAAERLRREFAEMHQNVRYCGQIDLKSLMEVRRQYSYSIVSWNPVAERALFAPSNKFFEAIADGVPPITAPHPQHKLLVERYDCGLVMDDWSYESFYRTIRHGLRLYGTPDYDQMVENCRTAVAEELNWPHQFDGVRPYLRKAG